MMKIVKNIEFWDKILMMNDNLVIKNTLWKGNKTTWKKGNFQMLNSTYKLYYEGQIVVKQAFLISSEIVIIKPG